MLTCVRWYAAYPLSLRHIEEMMTERRVFVDHATVHPWAIKIAANGSICTELSIAMAIPSTSCFVPTETTRPHEASLSKPSVCTVCPRR